MIDQRFIEDLAQDLVVPKEPTPEMQLASANTGVTTDGGAFVGYRMNMPKGLNTPENQAKQSVLIADTLAGGGKGMMQGFVGLPGDLESIGRMALNYLGYNVDENTALPTSEEIGKKLESVLGPVIPQGQTTSVPTAERVRAAEGGTTGGEIIAPGGQIKLGAKVAKPVIGATKKIIEAGKDLPVGMSIKGVDESLDPLGFYSAASKAVDNIAQEKGTGAQFLAQIEKTPGVKKEELLWTGLDDFLKGKKTVTKAEVQDFLNNNRVEIQEVNLSDADLKKKFSVNSPPDQDYYDVVDKQGKVIFSGPEDDADYLIDRSLTKFSQYTLPGGENYREVLLTLPRKNFEKPDADGQIPFSQEFQSQHFDQPNIVAHMRLNDRVDADGKKVLFVEEVQSDWHQAGRKKGYETPGKVEQLKQEVIAAKNELRSNESALAEKYGLPKKGDATTSLDSRMKWTRELLASMSDEEIAVRQALEGKIKDAEQAWATAGKGVPDAPFKTSWHELALKRAIQLASEGGYDRIAFTTGKQQTARYNLGSQVDELLVTKNDNGTFYIEAVLKDGRGIETIGEDIVPDKLDDLVGKELGNKIRNQQNKGDIYDGNDLDVGGEGMKGFYDNILPKYLNKYAKKWDAKVGMTEIPTSNLNIDNKIIFEDGKYLVDAGDGINYNSYDTKAEAIKSLGGDNPSVHYMDITPKMKESVLTKGQPLFQMAPAIPAGMAAGQQEDNK